MTSLERLDEIGAMTVAYHRAKCVHDEPSKVWPDAHMRVDRRIAARQVDQLHAAGRVVSPAEVCGALLSDDVIAVPA